MSGNTWGIGGIRFIELYVLALVIMLVVGLLIRWAIRATGSKIDRQEMTDRLAARPIDVAYLNGGDRLAVLAACSALRVAKALRVRRRTQTVAARSVTLSDDVPRLARLIHRSARATVRWSRLSRDTLVAAELREIRQRLVLDRLVASPAQRAGQRAVVVPMLALLGLGIARLCAAGDKPAGYLLACILATVVASGWLLMSVPTRTRTGDQVLERLTDAQQALAPRMRPDWTSYGPAAAALGVGVFGVSALQVADPGFAAGMGLSRGVSASGSTGSTSVGGAGTSGSSTAGCSGSSCGGGGGCGGGGCGGGGCGGGGCGG